LLNRVSRRDHRYNLTLTKKDMTKYIIKMIDGIKYWTDTYTQNDNFFEFLTKTKEGKLREVKVNVNQVAEITNLQPEQLTIDKRSK
jgi:hypothetical protein